MESMYLRKEREISSCPQTLGWLYKMNAEFLKFGKTLAILWCSADVEMLLIQLLLPFILNKILRKVLNHRLKKKKKERKILYLVLTGGNNEA